jgi:hypothetical protein
LKLGDQESVFDNGEWVPGNDMKNNTVLNLWELYCNSVNYECN